MNKKIIGLMSSLLILTSVSGCNKSSNSSSSVINSMVSSSSSSTIINSSSSNTGNLDEIYIEFERDTSELDGKLNFPNPVSYTYEEIEEILVNDYEDIADYYEVFNYYGGRAGIEFKYIKKYIDYLYSDNDSYSSKEAIEEYIETGVNNLKSLLFELTEDQFISLTNSTFGNLGTTSPAMMPYSLSKLKEIQGYAETIGRNDIVEHFKQIESYYDLFGYNRTLSVEEREYDEETVVLMKASIRLIKEFFARLTNDEMKFIYGSLFMNRIYDAPSSIFPTYEANIINIVNKLGRAIKAFNLSEKSYKLVFDNIYYFLLNNNLLEGDLVNVTFNEELVKAYDRVKSFVTGEDTRAVIKLVGVVLEKITMSDVENFIGDSESMFNALQAFDIAKFLNKVMNELSSDDKKALNSLANKLGFSFDEFIEKLVNLNIEDQDNLNDLGAYLTPIMNNINDTFLFINQRPNYCRVLGNEDEGYNNLYYDAYKLNSKTQPAFEMENHEEGTYTYEFKNFDTSEVGKHTCEIIVTYEGNVTKYEYTYLVLEDFIYRMGLYYQDALIYEEKYVYGNKQYFALDSEPSYFVDHLRAQFTSYDYEGAILGVSYMNDFIGLDTSYVHDGYFFIEWEGLYYAIEYSVYDPANVKETLSCEQYYYVQTGEIETKKLKINKNYAFANGEEVPYQYENIDVEINRKELGKHSVVIDCFDGQKFTYEYEVVALEDCRSGMSAGSSLMKTYVDSLDEVVIERWMSYEYFDGEKWCDADAYTSVYEAEDIIFEEDENNPNKYVAYVYDDGFWGWSSYNIYILEKWNVEELNEFLGFEVSSPDCYYSNINVEVTNDSATLSFDGYMSESRFERYIEEALHGIGTYEYDDNGRRIFYIENSNIIVTYDNDTYNDKITIYFEKTEYDYSKGWLPNYIKDRLGFELKAPSNYDSVHIEEGYGAKVLYIAIYGIDEESSDEYIESLGLRLIENDVYCLNNNNKLAVQVIYNSSESILTMEFQSMSDLIDNYYENYNVKFEDDNAFFIGCPDGSVQFFYDSLTEEQYLQFIDTFCSQNNINKCYDENNNEYYCFASNEDLKVRFYYEYNEVYNYYTITVLIRMEVEVKPVEPDVEVPEVDKPVVEVPDVYFVEFGDKNYDEYVEVDEEGWYSVQRTYMGITLEEYEQYKSMVIDENTIISYDEYIEEDNSYFVIFCYEGDNIGHYTLVYFAEYEMMGIVYSNY